VDDIIEVVLLLLVVVNMYFIYRRLDVLAGRWDDAQKEKEDKYAKHRNQDGLLTTRKRHNE